MHRVLASFCRPLSRAFSPAILTACILIGCLYPSKASAQALQAPGSTQSNVFDPGTTTDPATAGNPGGAVAADVAGKNMPNLYYAYMDPSYSTGAKGSEGFKNDVVQKVVLAVQGITQPTNSTIYGTSTHTYKYVWAFFGLLIGFGLLLSGWHCYQDVISGRATNDVWVWYIARIMVAALMWTSLINNAPLMMISFINQFTGMPSNSLSQQLQTATTSFTDSNAYLQAVATGKTSGTLVPYLTSVAVAYNTLDKTTVWKSAQAISSVVDFQKQLGYNPQQAQKWVQDMYAVSYRIHLDNQGSDALENQYGYNMSEVIGGANWFTVSWHQLSDNIAAKLSAFAQVKYVPPPQLSPDDQIVATFLASQRAASLKFYTQVTNRLRAIAGQPLLPLPGTPPTNDDGWLGPNSGTDRPAGINLRFPDATTNNQNTNNPSNTNPDNTLTAAGMLENAIPQPGEAPPVSRLVHQPGLVKNVVNFALVEIGVSIWSLPLLLMMTTVFLLLPPQLTGKSYTQHSSQAFLHILTLLIACALISTFVELATMNSATDLLGIVQANKSDVSFSANLGAFSVGQLFGAYDPVTIVYTGLILASLPIAVGIVQGSNKLASAAWGALNSSGMSGVTAMNAIESGQSNTWGSQIIRTTSSIATGGFSDIVYDQPPRPRAPTSPSR